MDFYWKINDFGMEKIYLLSDEATIPLECAAKSCEILSFGKQIVGEKAYRIAAPLLEEGFRIAQKRREMGYNKVICLYSSYPGVNMAHYYRMIFSENEAVFIDTKTLFPATMVYYHYFIKVFESGYDDETVRKDLETFHQKVKLFFTVTDPQKYRPKERSLLFKKNWKQILNYFPLLSVDEKGQIISVGQEKGYEGILTKMSNTIEHFMDFPKYYDLFVASENRQIDFEQIQKYFQSNMKRMGKMEFYSTPKPIEDLFGKGSIAVSLGMPTYNMGKVESFHG